jgi:hypothetical protein
MNSNLPSMTAIFVLSGNKLDPYKCTRRLKIAPTKQRLKKEISLGSFPIQPYWSVSTTWAKFNSTDVVLQLLFSRVWSKREKIRQFAKESRLKTTIVLNIRGGIGGRNFLYEFFPRTLKQISYFEASLHLDVY